MIEGIGSVRLKKNVTFCRSDWKPSHVLTEERYANNPFEFEFEFDHKRALLFISNPQRLPHIIDSVIKQLAVS